MEFLGKTLLITAGQDNFLKFWRFDEIDDVEPEEDLIYEISIVKSIHLFKNAHVVSINTEFFEKKGVLFVKCTNGKIFKILFRDYMIIMSQHHDEVIAKDYSKIVESNKYSINNNKKIVRSS